MRIEDSFGFVTMHRVGQSAHQPASGQHRIACVNLALSIFPTAAMNTLPAVTSNKDQSLQQALQRMLAEFESGARTGVLTSGTRPSGCRCLLAPETIGTRESGA